MDVERLAGADEILGGVDRLPFEEPKQHRVAERLRAVGDQPFPGERRQRVALLAVAEIAGGDEEVEELLQRPGMDAEVAGDGGRLGRAVGERVEDAELGRDHDGAGDDHGVEGVDHRRRREAGEGRDPLEQRLRVWPRPASRRLDHGEVQEAEEHPRALRDDAEDALAAADPARGHQFLEHDVDRRRAGVALGGEVGEPALPRNREAALGEAVIEALAEPVRGEVRQQPVDARRARCRGAPASGRRTASSAPAGGR